MTKVDIKETKLMNINIADIRSYVRSTPDDDNLLLSLLSFAQKQLIDELKISINPIEINLSISPKDSSEFLIPISPVIDIKTSTYDGKSVGKNEVYLKDDRLKINIPNRDKKLLVTINCGYQKEEDLPSDIKLATLMQVAYLYDNRGGYKNIIAPSVNDILRRFKKIRF